MANTTADPGLFRLAGIPVHVPISGVIGVALLAYLWAPAFADTAAGASQWVLAAAFAVLLSLATLVHEFAHALTAKAFGFPVHKVVLQLMGGVTYYERRLPSPAREAAIAASGPAATFAAAGLSAAVAAVAPVGSATWTLAQALMWANLVMGVYNSLPGAPLDGGSVLRCLVWGVTGSERKGAVAAARAGQAVAVATMATPALLAVALGFRFDLLAFVLIGLLAAMLWQGATAQLRSLDLRDRAAGISAGRLARRAIPVDRETPLAEALRRCELAGAGAFVVVDALGAPLAISQSAAVAAVPLSRRPWVAASSVARTLEPRATIPMDLGGPDLISAVANGGFSEYLVVDPAGLVYGVMATADLEAALRAPA